MGGNRGADQRKLALMLCPAAHFFNEDPHYAQPLGLDDEQRSLFESDLSSLYLPLNITQNRRKFLGSGLLKPGDYAQRANDMQYALQEYRDAGYDVAWACFAQKTGSRKVDRSVLPGGSYLNMKKSDDTFSHKVSLEDYLWRGDVPHLGNLLLTATGPGSDVSDLVIGGFHSNGSLCGLVHRVKRQAKDMQRDGMYLGTKIRIDERLTDYPLQTYHKELEERIG